MVIVIQLTWKHAGGCLQYYRAIARQNLQFLFKYNILEMFQGICYVLNMNVERLRWFGHFLCRGWRFIFVPGALGRMGSETKYFISFFNSFTVIRNLPPQGVGLRTHHRYQIVFKRSSPPGKFSAFQTVLMARWSCRIIANQWCTGLLGGRGRRSIWRTIQIRLRRQRRVRRGRSADDAIYREHRRKTLSCSLNISVPRGQHTIPFSLLLRLHYHEKQK